MHNLRRKASLAVALAAATLAVGLGATTTAAGAQSAAPAPAAAQAVTDYAEYPAALPTGCPDGSSALLGVQFDNGRGGTADDLRALDVRNGDTLTMTWTDYAPGCLTGSGEPAIVVSMVVYDAGVGTFDPAVDQALQPGWTACGPGQAACVPVDGHYRLSVVIPTADVVCNIQAGAVIGLPLAVVGPHGSYYNSVLRGDERPNMLIAATNFATTPCPVPTAAPGPTTVPTTAPPPTTAAAVAPAAATVTTVAPTTIPLGVEAATAQRAPLPNTGGHAELPLIVGTTLLLLGGAAFLTERLLTERRR